MTRTDLASRYPGIDDELDRVEKWFDVPLHYHLKREPADRHFPPVTNAFDAYTDDASLRRLHRIMVMAKKMQNVPKSGPWPIFIYEEDGFLLEGWHRLVAFRMLGMDEVDVVTVRRSLPSPDPSSFSPDQVRIEEDDWCFSARWKRQQIGHLRLNRDEHPTERYVDNTFVLPSFRRRGIASRLYDAADLFLKGQGLCLVPSPASALSKDAAALWASRNHEA